MNLIAARATVSSKAYEHVGRRIQMMVSDPKVQKHQAVSIKRRDDEALDAWDRVLQELDETDGVTVERLGQDHVRIGWRSYLDC